MKNVFLMAVFVFMFSAAAWGGFSADMLMETTMGVESGRIYHQGADRSRTEMQGMVTIMNGSDVYYLFEKTGKYFQEDVKELTAKNPSAAIRDFDQFIRSNGLRKTGTDSIEGYKCEIYQGDVDFGQAAGGQFESAPIKIWYARKLDYALKTEATLPSPMGRAVTRLKNIKTGSQPGSLFTVPAEYDRAGTMQEAMGLGQGFNLPEGLEGMEGLEGISGDMPSPEEMEEIMKKMQEMLKQQN